MDRLAKWITKHSKLIVIAFALMSIISAVLFFTVKVNYDMTRYLPEDAQSTLALHLMSDEFATAVPNARVMAPNVSVTEAADLKRQMQEIDGVAEVMWLDDIVDLKMPIETLDPSMVNQYYKDGYAIYDVVIEQDMEVSATNKIYDIIGEDGGITGIAANVAYSQNQIVREVVGACVVLLPSIIIILLLTTNSWISPMLFLLTIGVAVIINMGTNVIFGSISYITQSVSPILQLAVSLDYAIFLLGSFERFRKTEKDPETAMQLAIKESFVSIAASAATTVLGFLALVFMRFGIGSDLGLNLVKGVALSYISAVVFLPALSLCCIKLIDKTEHKRIIPELHKIGTALVKIRIPALIIVIILVIPCFLAQSRSDFFYGNGAPAPGSRYGEDTIKINETFGENTAIVLMVPKGDIGRESEMCKELQKIPHVTSVLSYASTVGSSIPAEFLSKDITSNFYSENYARIIVNTDTPEEGGHAFDVVKDVREVASEYYEENYSCGQSANLYDMKYVVLGDTNLVNGLAIVFILLTLLISFKSLNLPVILIFVIESAIWINLSTPYFTDTPLVYLGYLVINTVQLGATIDYAILITDGYVVRRRTMNKLAAVMGTINDNLISLVTSGLILSTAGLSLKISSSMEIVKALGGLLFRGTLLSMAMVIMALPALLILFDTLTVRLTKGEFLNKKHEPHRNKLKNTGHEEVESK